MMWLVAVVDVFVQKRAFDRDDICSVPVIGDASVIWISVEFECKWM